jgi:uncharacterized membrane protein
MPNLAEFHPQIVHFIIALGFVGILLRIASLAGKGAWMHPAAAVLIIIAAGASVAGVKSGVDAHGPAERVPGAREAVQEHEEWGERTRNLLLIVAGLEVLGLIFASRRGARAIRALSAVGGVVAMYSLYEAGEHGGELVYNYAGGVGTRSGNPGDLTNALVAALFHKARMERDSGRTENAARLTDELARQRPDDPNVKLLVVESKLRDRNDPQGALADLRAMPVPLDDARLAPRHGLLAAQAYVAAGHPDSARLILTPLATRFPNNRGIQDALAKLP